MNVPTIRTGSLLSVLAMLAAATATSRVYAQDASKFAVAQRFTVGGEGGWDYLTAEPGTNRLFLSRSSHVMVVDRTTGKLLGDIPNTPGVHGVALVERLGRGFTSNGRDGTVTEFDLKSLKALRTIDVGAQNPDAIFYDSVSDRVFTFNGRSSNATAIDAQTGDVAGHVALDGKPEAAASDGEGHVFVNIEDKAEITEFDARTLKVMATWPLPGCEEPTGLAVDRETRRLFSGCGGNATMAIVDYGTGREVATLPIGRGVDGVAFDAGLHLAFATAGEGEITVVREDGPDSFSVVQTVPTARGARTIGLDPVRHEVFTVTAKIAPEAASPSASPRRPTYAPGTFEVLVVARSGAR